MEDQLQEQMEDQLQEQWEDELPPSLLEEHMEDQLPPGGSAPAILQPPKQRTPSSAAEKADYQLLREKRYYMKK